MTVKAMVVKTRAYALGLVLAIGFLSAAPATAQSWKITDGRNYGMLLPSDSRKLPDGTTYLTGGARYVIDTEDPSYPITGQSMDCRWICKVPASGKDVACITFCGGIDKDGDLFSFRAPAGGPNGYEVGPGTGKYANATGGGTFETITPADPALTIIRWKGTLQLK